MQIKIQQTRDTMTPDLRKQIAAMQDPSRALKAMGTVIVSLAQRAFTDAGLRPAAWAPLSPATLKQRRAQNRGSKPLLRTGLLARSPRVAQVTRKSVTVAADRPYAMFQQLGTQHIPARPFFPFDKSGRPTPRARTLMMSAATRALGLKP